ncbi:hypothetical protein DYB36_010187 [Aphanomyces astaci]|uniref:GED domain-containing protein n=1 Tax=Aphanomyces astaci TaxID=112090 RepID=A0A397A777_APHAT|nr:hypothetical protein DYB36_010187 [Aphanomyces astaci]RHZ13357.1 hypothetical protein DYB31_000854 [Aphanomyces astaci]
MSSPHATRHLIDRLRAVGLDKYVQLPQVADASTVPVERVLPTVVADTYVQLASCKDKLAILGEPMTTPAVRRATFMKNVSLMLDRLEGGVSGNYNDTFFDDTENRLQARLGTAESEFQDAIEEVSIVDGTAALDMSTPEVASVGDFVEVFNGEWVMNAAGETIRDPNVKWELDQVTQVETTSNEVLTAKHFKREWRDSSEWRFLPPTFANIVRQRYVVKWKRPMRALFEMCQTLLLEFVTRVTGSMKCKPKLQAHLNHVAHDMLESLSTAALVELDKLIETECDPSTLNLRLGQVLLELRTKPLIVKLDVLSGNNDATSVSVGAMKALLKRHFTEETNSNEDLLVKELHLAIGAYMAVASKRFVDEIPKLLNTKYIQPFLSAVRNEASETSDQVLGQVLMDDVADVEQYETLSNQLKALEAANTLINAHLFPSPY